MLYFFDLTTQHGNFCPPIRTDFSKKPFSKQMETELLLHSTKVRQCFHKELLVPSSWKMEIIAHRNRGNSEHYRAILGNVLEPKSVLVYSTKTLGLNKMGQLPTLQISPCKLFEEYFQEKSYRNLFYAPISPDLTPIDIFMRFY